MNTDFSYRQGSGEYLYIDVINATDNTSFHEIKCPLRYKAVDIQPLSYLVYLYVKNTDVNYKTINAGSSLSIDLSKASGDTSFYIRSSSNNPNRIELLFLS